MPSSPTPLDAWWGEFRLPSEGARRWTIGPLRIEFAIQSQELRVFLTRDADPHSNTVECNVSIDEIDDALDEPPPYSEAKPNGPEMFRVATDRVGDTFRLVPRMADRSVIARPREPLYLPARHRVSVFVSSPLWFEVRLAQGDALLFERPIFRPSDTWFGSSTLLGELAYASRTSARLHLENTPHYPHRAITAVHIHNEDDEPLEFEHLRIPAPSLDLYSTAEGHLFTQDVVLTRRTTDDRAELSVPATAPQHAGRSTRISKHRYPLRKEGLLSSFGQILRVGGDHV